MIFSFFIYIIYWYCHSTVLHNLLVSIMTTTASVAPSHILRQLSIATVQLSGVTARRPLSPVGILLEGAGSGKIVP